MSWHSRNVSAGVQYSILCGSPSIIICDEIHAIFPPRFGNGYGINVLLKRGLYVQITFSR